MHSKMKELCLSSLDRHTKSVSTGTVKQLSGTENICKRTCEAFLSDTEVQLTSNNNEYTSCSQNICDIKSISVSIKDDVKDITSDINDNEKRSEILFTSNDCSEPSGSDVYNAEDSRDNNTDCATHVNAPSRPTSRKPNDFITAAQQKVSNKDVDKNVNQGSDCFSPQQDSLAKQVTICFPEFLYHLPINESVVWSDLSCGVSCVSHSEKVKDSDVVNQENLQLHPAAYTRNVTVNEGDEKANETFKCQQHKENLNVHKNSIAANALNGPEIGRPRMLQALNIDIDRCARTLVSQEFDQKTETNEQKWKKNNCTTILQHKGNTL